MKKEKSPSKPMTVVQKILMWGLFVTAGLSVGTVSLLALNIPVFLPGENYLFLWLFLHFVGYCDDSVLAWMTFLVLSLIALFSMFSAAVGVKKNQTFLPAIGLTYYVAEVLFTLYKVIQIFIAEHNFFTTAAPVWAMDAFFITLFILYFRQKVLEKKAQPLQTEAAAA